MTNKRRTRKKKVAKKTEAELIAEVYYKKANQILVANIPIDDHEAVNKGFSIRENLENFLTYSHDDGFICLTNRKGIPWHQVEEVYIRKNQVAVPPPIEYVESSEDEGSSSSSEDSEETSGKD